MTILSGSVAKKASEKAIKGHIAKVEVSFNDFLLEKQLYAETLIKEKVLDNTL